jgi:hypothetical protein
MAGNDFRLIPFPHAVGELDLANHFGNRRFNQYYRSADEEIAFIESMPSVKADHEIRGPDWRDRVRKKNRPMRYVRHYAGNGTIEGDIDLDELSWANVAGLVVDGDLTINGSLLNWESSIANFLAVRGNLLCHNIVTGCADMVVRGDAKASNVIVSTYGQGRLEIRGDAYARYFIVEDDHWTLVGRDIYGYGWRSGSSDIPLPDSDWIDEIRPEFRSEFFEEAGGMKCANGSFDLVQALLAGRAILKR